ncbi:MAG: DUF1350 family protein [Cyanobacteria bacterium P01_F01_bin.86]
MNPKIQFRPISHSWVAMHPQPQGVIQFIGGAFFGTFFPMLWYQHFLKSLFDRRYTLVLLPFKFTFNHYREVFFLLREQYSIIPELVERAGGKHDIYIEPSNYYWCGHSIGCKYVTLLEGFGALPENKAARAGFIREIVSSDPARPYTEAQIQAIVADINYLIVGLRQEIAFSEARVNRCLQEDPSPSAKDSHATTTEDFAGIFIKNQISLLLAPDNSATASAIKPNALAYLIDRLGLGVNPSPKQTKTLMQKGDLFNLMGLICFASDKVANVTCNWFIDLFKKPTFARRDRLEGGHLKLLGLQVGNSVLNPFNRPWVESMATRNDRVEAPVLKLLQKLRQFQQEQLHLSNQTSAEVLQKA